MTTFLINEARAIAAFVHVAMCLLAYKATAEDHHEIAVPSYHDAYSASVAQLESGKTDIDYTAFRGNFIESEQFKVASAHTSDLSALRAKLPELKSQHKLAEVVEVCQQMLSIDYTDLEAHKTLQQASKIHGDLPNNKKYHDIEFGLLNSIVKKGDGKTPQTAWPVIQLQEEYFILKMLDARLHGQSLINVNGVPYDKMEVETEKGATTYYFEISKVFLGYKKLGIQ